MFKKEFQGLYSNLEQYSQNTQQKWIGLLIKTLCYHAKHLGLKKHTIKLDGLKTSKGKK